MKIRRFAEGTSVPVERSRQEIETLLRRNGATGFASAWQKERFTIAFEMKGRRCRFDVPAPDPKKYRTTHSWEAEDRRRWRALLLIIKAKLELVSSGDADFEAEFLAQMLTPDGTTVGERLLPHLAEVLNGAPMPPMLPGAR